VPDESALRSVRMLVAVCQAQTDRIYAHLDKYGVSVGLVYHVERLRAQLHRIGRLLALRTAPRSDQGAVQVQAVLVDLIVAHHRRASVRDLVSRSFALLARKMVERNADRGERYIAPDRAAYRAILKAALLGGAIAALPAAAKIGLAHLGPAHFFEGLFLSLIFALSFLLISAVGGVLAARQPAVTAPTLAMETAELDTPDGMRTLLTRAAALLRAQWAAVFGNLLAVVPTVVAMALAVWFIGGRPVMHEYRADATLHSLSLLGVTPLFAAFTGVLLWLAGLIAGFADNWFALRRLRESIAHHRRVVHALGPHRAERWAAWLERNAASIAGNLALALLLGMTPSVAQFFGLPLDVRHVTLSAAALTAAAFSLGWHVLTTPQFWLAVAGVVAIGLLNVGVAFTCALGLALRARDVSRRTRRMAFRAVWRRWLLRPAEFLWPVAVVPVAVTEVEQEPESEPEPETVLQEEER
ncbi:MAG TPA: preprotein translocase subunit TatB, partial [Oxalicibacterium sp.]|nr:preprotein translocase subunit TatB [Oxalicibacterium sp.]